MAQVRSCQQETLYNLIDIELEIRQIAGAAQLKTPEPDAHNHPLRPPDFITPPPPSHHIEIITPQHRSTILSVGPGLGC
jgi:hypothetical protein